MTTQNQKLLIAAAFALLFFPVPVFVDKLALAPLGYWIALCVLTIVNPFAWGACPIWVQTLALGWILFLVLRSVTEQTWKIRQRWLRILSQASLLALPFALSVITPFRLGGLDPYWAREDWNVWQVVAGEMAARRAERDLGDYQMWMRARELAAGGHYAEAEPIFRKRLELERQKDRGRYGSDMHGVRLQLVELAWVLKFQGKHDEAEAIAREAQAIVERLWEKRFRISETEYRAYSKDLPTILSAQGTRAEMDAVFRPIHSPLNGPDWAPGSKRDRFGQLVP